MRIGLYPGTFDPIHEGHMAFAETALLKCNLDRVIFLPEHRPRGKQERTSTSHRVSLLQKATNGAPHFGVMQLSSERFTVRETLPELKSHFGDMELTLLLGSDVAAHLPDWPDVDLLLRAMDLAIGLRAGDSEDALREHLASTSTPLRVVFVTTSFPGITSSQIRSGKAGLLSKEVAEYARSQNLYDRTDRS